VSVGRKWSGPRTGSFGRRLMSPSEAEKIGGQGACLARWGFHRLEGIREPQGDAAKAGDLFHKELEDYNLWGIQPTSAEALALLKFSPAPGVALVEVPFRYDTANVPWRGYGDLVYDIELHEEPITAQASRSTRLELVVKGTPRPIGTTWNVVIHDWKTTGDVSKNAKSMADLRKDYQANFYAMEAFLGGAERVFARWCYVQTKGRPYVREVWYEFRLDEVLNVVEDMDRVAALGQQLHSIRPKPRATDLPKNLDTCFAYGRKCPYWDLCKPNKKITMSATASGEKYMSDVAKFREQMMASFPGTVEQPVKKSPPPPPPKKAPPPPPPSKSAQAPDLSDQDAAQLVADAYPNLKNFVNPPEQHATPAATPEEAAVQQGVEAPKAPEKDDLDDMERDQLKTLGVALGAFPENTKMRAPGMRDAIRIKRKEAPQQRADAAADASYEEHEADKAAELVEAPAVDEQGTTCFKAAQAAARVLEQMTTPEKPAEVPAQQSSLDFVLYVNCMPVATHALSQSKLVEVGNAMIREQSGHEDYRLVEYGKGAAYLGLAVTDAMLSGKFGVFTGVVLDTRTPEGQALLTSIEALAIETVRGF